MNIRFTFRPFKDTPIFSFITFTIRCSGSFSIFKFLSQLSLVLLNPSTLFQLKVFQHTTKSSILVHISTIGNNFFGSFINYVDKHEGGDQPNVNDATKDYVVDFSTKGEGGQNLVNVIYEKSLFHGLLISYNISIQLLIQVVQQKLNRPLCYQTFRKF